LALGVCGIAAMPLAAHATEENQPIAVVDGEAISKTEFQQSLVQIARQRFYHGKIDHEKMATLGDEVVEALVMRRLLLASAEEREIEADSEAVEAQLQRFNKRYADNPEWQQSKDGILPDLRRRLEEDSRIARLERGVRMVAEPDTAALETYYQANPSKFTEPVQERVAMILIGVAPWAEKEIWQAAADQTADLKKRLDQGEGFAALAETHSTDPSGQNGGDLGYGHHGMLAAPAQELVDALDVGGVSAPVRLLQGYAIFKLLDRQPERLQPLAEVKERALGLYRRDQAEAQWLRFQQHLRDAAAVTINWSAEEPHATTAGE